MKRGVLTAAAGAAAAKNLYPYANTAYKMYKMYRAYKDSGMDMYRYAGQHFGSARDEL